MFNKKLMILAIVLVSLFAISAASAADNVTDDAVVNVEDSHDVINQNCSAELAEDNSENSYDSENLSSSSNKDAVSFEEDDDVLSNSPPYYAYDLYLYDTTKYYGSEGSISISISPSTSSSYSYRYDFYLKVYDSKNNEKINKRYYGGSTRSETFKLGETSLAIGTYTMKLVNYADSKVMKTAKLYVISVNSNAYSVSVSDTPINYGSSGKITMTINPALGYYYRYDFYLKVYDSKNNEKISKRYYSSNPSSEVTYTIEANVLDRGTYTIKILNNGDNKVMDTANLFIYSLTYNAYSVSVSDITMNYGSEGTITMTIYPASSKYYYGYDFYLKIYDSKNNEKISKRYYSTLRGVSKITKTYNIGSTQFEFGEYTIKILNTYDKQVMRTAKLNINKINIESDNLNTNYTDTIEYKVRVSLNDTYTSGLNVIFTCNGKTYSVTTDNNGYATLNIHLKSGTYDITTKSANVVNENIVKINPVFVANKYKDVYVKSLNGCYGDGIHYGWKGNFEGYFVIYKGNKLLYKTKLNSNGYIDDYFKYTSHDKYYGGSAIKNLGTFRAMITDVKGNAITAATIKISKSPTNIKCNSLKIKAGSKRTINAYIFDKHGSRKDINGIAKFKIKGKTYKVKVKNGHAIIKKIKFSYKEKTYKCNVKFLGDKNHKASSKNFKIRVKKLKSYIGTYAPATKVGSKSIIYAWVHVKNLDGKISKVKSGTVKFTIAGKTYFAKVKNGNAKINIIAPSKGKTYHGKAIYMGKKYIRPSSDKIYLSVKPMSKYKIITTYANYYWITKKSGGFTVKTIIWDMTAGFRAPGKYIDTTLYKHGRQVYNSEYSVKYKINGEWTGWAKYGTTSTAHHRYFVWDSDCVEQIKVKVKRDVNSFF